MARTKLAFLALFAFPLLQVPWRAVARRHHDPDSCGDAVLLGYKDHRCSCPAVLPQDGFPNAVMVLTTFDGRDGPAECDGLYHSDGDMVAALSTEWYANGSRCMKRICIWNSTRTRSALVEVVDECDSDKGCKDNMVATSQAVWDALLLDPNNIGEVAISWADA